MTLEKIEKSKSLNDDLHVKLLEVDLEEYDIGIRNGKNQLKHLDQEIKIFLDLVDEADKEYDIEKLAEGDIHNDVVERKYWIERMAKQATLDLLEHGSIAVGNMDSIINMDKEAQKEIFYLATGNYYQLKSGLEEAEVNSLPMTELRDNPRMLLEGSEQLKLDRDILE